MHPPQHKVGNSWSSWSKLPGGKAAGGEGRDSSVFVGSPGGGKRSLERKTSQKVVRNDSEHKNLATHGFAIERKKSSVAPWVTHLSHILSEKACIRRTITALLLFACFSCLWMVPFFVAFWPYLSESALTSLIWVDTAMDALFWADAVIAFAAYLFAEFFVASAVAYTHDQLTQPRRRITLRSTLLVLSLLPYQWIAAAPLPLEGRRVLLSLHVLKLGRLRHYYRRGTASRSPTVGRWIKTSRRHILEVACALLVFVHYAGCLFFYAGALQPTGRSWATMQPMQQLPADTMYFRSFFWAMTTVRFRRAFGALLVRGVW